MKHIWAFALLIAACGGDTEAPTCSEAVSTYYAAGCVVTDVNGAPYSAGEWITVCRQDSAIVEGTQCEDEFDELMFCFAEVSVDDCALCDIELDRLVACGGSL